MWPDVAVKREIASLKVKCGNYMVGCDWTGLFKNLEVLHIFWHAICCVQLLLAAMYHSFLTINTL